MKILDYDAPLGISITGHPAEAVHDFVAYGFTHFEVGIPAALPGTARGFDKYDYSPEVTAAAARLACRGQEQRLVALKQPLVDAIEQHKLRVWSVHLPFGTGWDIAHWLESERDAVCTSLKRVIDLTAGWKPRVYVLHGCLEPVSDAERPVRIARSIRSLKELDAYAAQYGARVALENLPRSCLANCSLETRAMAQAANDVPICFDVNHLLGEDHAAFIDALAERVITTHLSDYDGIDERHWLPGAGIVPWKLVVERLMASGYRGPFLFELRSGENGPYDARTVRDRFISALQQ